MRAPLVLTFAIAFFGVLTTPLLAADELLTLRAEAAGYPIQIEIAPFGEQRQHRDALTDALREMNQVVALADPDGETPGGLGELNRSDEVVELDERLAAALGRAQVFCGWTRGTHGPLGGELYRLWGVGGQAEALPTPADLAELVSDAPCAGLELPGDANIARRSRGRVLMHGFLRGWAVDRAIDVLRASGAPGARVAMGRVMRAYGDSREGGGWAITLTADDEGFIQERVVLRNMAAAAASMAQPRISIAGEHFAPYLNQRTGRPTADGKLAVMTATELAFDAEGLAVTLWLWSQREGTYRLGELQPEPAVLWLSGTGEGDPLLFQRGWARLPKW